MNASQISDIEDYCRDLPKTHTWKDLSIPPTEVEVLERMVPDYIGRLEAGVPSEKAKTQIQQKYHRSIKPTHFNRIYQRLRAAGTLAKSPAFEASMISKACRGLSGVSVITVFLSPYPNGQKFSCKWNCNYCPNEPGQPRSYLFGEPGVLRANQLGFDCVEQMRVRIDAYRVNGHPTDKFEVLVLGGTLHSYPQDYLETFMRDIYYGANTCSLPSDKGKRGPGTLAQEQGLNARGDHKVIGLTVETRPDCVTAATLVDLRRWGVTRVQLGVQHTDDAILRAVNRGCSHRHTVAALALLRDNCFKVDIHIMPNLPTSTPDKDRAMMDVVLSELQPDQVKVYPCETTPFTKILEDFKAGTYVPYSHEELKEVVIYWKTRVSPWIRNNRIVRDIPNYYIVAGVPSSSERCVYQEEMRRRGLMCRCIRCREVGRQPAPEEVGAGQLVIRRYRAAAGEELFLSWVSENSRTLYGFCRLRLPPPASAAASPFPELKGLALIRELHVYGRTLATGDADDASRGGAPVAQHTGLGRRLLEAAEWQAWVHGYSGTAVIAGIGTRGYYSRFGYQLDQGAGRFMIRRWIPFWTVSVAISFIIILGLLYFLVQK
jgi:ELP3 family radical SAM enzyme/protein acetyltransferase